MDTKKIVICTLLLIVSCTLSYYFLDKQLVWLFSGHHTRDLSFLRIMSDYIPNAIGAFIALFYIYFVFQMRSVKHSEPADKPRHSELRKLLIMCNAVVIALFLKDTLKWVFGRSWASTFICNNPSLLEHHVYGFHWFRSGAVFNSFPSGHATIAFSFSTSMWFLFPTLRWLWSILAAMVVIGQLTLYYHFFSDVLAGAALGSVVAICNYRYWVQSQFSARLRQ